MKELPILIVADSFDLHAGGVLKALQLHQVEAEWVDFASLNKNVRLTLTLNDVSDARLITSSGRKIMLSEVDTIWWRRPRRPEDDAALDEKTRAFVRGEWKDFLEGLEAVAPARWVNPPHANRLAELKTFQLIAAKEIGLRVPDTIMTNDLGAVRELIGKGMPLIYKSFGAAQGPPTATKAFLPSDVKRLDTLCNCPAIFQERIDAKLDIRVTVIGNDVYAAEIDSQAGQSPLDWRLDHTVPFRPHTLNDKTSAQLLALVQRLGLLYGAIDLRLTPDDEYVFLEINPSGQYLFIELLANIPLSERMAEFLAGDHW